MFTRISLKSNLITILMNINVNSEITFKLCTRLKYYYKNKNI